jgi:flagellar protein FlbD
MVLLTRLDHEKIAINCDLIEWVEAKPDTTVRLVSGESILVLETLAEVMRRIRDYRIGILAGAGLASVLGSGARPGRAALALATRSRPGGSWPGPAGEDEQEE